MASSMSFLDTVQLEARNCLMKVCNGCGPIAKSRREGSVPRDGQGHDGVASKIWGIMVAGIRQGSLRQVADTKSLP